MEYMEQQYLPDNSYADMGRALCTERHARNVLGR